MPSWARVEAVSFQHSVCCTVMLSSYLQISRQLKSLMYIRVYIVLFLIMQVLRTFCRICTHWSQLTRFFFPLLIQEPSSCQYGCIHRPCLARMPTKTKQKTFLACRFSAVVNSWDKLWRVRMCEENLMSFKPPPPPSLHCLPGRSPACKHVHYTPSSTFFLLQLDYVP